MYCGGCEQTKEQTCSEDIVGTCAEYCRITEYNCDQTSEQTCSDAIRDCFSTSNDCGQTSERTCVECETMSGRDTCSDTCGMVGCVTTYGDCLTNYGCDQSDTQSIPCDIAVTVDYC
jgi:hypothetical protein